MAKVPHGIALALKAQMVNTKNLHDADLALGYERVWMPHALERKYPEASRAWGWQYVFPAPLRSVDPRTGIVRRHHLGDQAFQRAMRQAVHDAGVHKPATPRPRARCVTP